jgi:hypothetical protein
MVHLTILLVTQTIISNGKVVSVLKRTWKEPVLSKFEVLLKYLHESRDQGVGVRVPVGTRIFNSPCRPDPLWGPSNELFPRG